MSFLRLNRMKNIFESKTNTWIQNFIPAILILIFFIHSILSVSQISRTFDESTHFKFGLNLLHGNAERPYESVMPISVWNALPKFISELEVIRNQSLNNLFSNFLIARSMTILFACATAYIVFRFSLSLYGFVSALFSLFLFIFDPNILAHSQLVTTDIFVTGALLLVIYTTWRYSQNRNTLNRIWLALSLGFSLITKYTAMSFIPLIFLILIIYDSRYRIKEDVYDRIKKYQYLLREYLTLIVFIALTSTLVLNIAYQFRQTFVPFGDYVFRSPQFINLQKKYSFLNSIPVPAPYAHLHGFDWILAYEQTGAGHGRHYLLGELKQGDGFYGYYIIAFFLKEPFSTQIIILLACILYFNDKVRRSNFWQRELFLFIPIIFYFIYFNFFYNSQIGIRYYLIIFPLLYIFAGSLFTKWDLFSQKQKTLTIFSIIYLIASVLSYFPYYIPYFNEFVWNRSMSYKYLADSNLDWGQGRHELEQYLLKNPDVSYATKYVRAGTLIISVNELVGATADPNAYAWLRNNFEPIDNIAYSYLIYHITPEEKKELCLNTSYCANK